MKIFMSCTLLLAGCGTFLLALKLLTESLEANTGKGVKRLFNKISNNRLLGYGIGASVTAIIQSSSATSVMTIGLISAGIINLFQAFSIILGANLGTTITGYIVALSSTATNDFKLSYVFACLTLIGILLSFFSNKKIIQKVAPLLVGFGLLFVGLDVMSSAFKAMNEPFTRLFSNPLLKNPFMLILIAIAFTALIQSSSAANAVFLTMLAFSGEGGITLDQAFFLVIGSNVGTCITAILASIGAKPDAKRVALFHVFANVFGAVVFLIITIIFRSSLVNLFENVFSMNDAWSLAIFNTFFNLLSALLILPLLRPIVKLMSIIIKDKKDKSREGVIKYINEQVLAAPSFAVSQVQKEVLNMAIKAKVNLDSSLNAIILNDTGSSQSVYKLEEDINYLNREITLYLIKLSSLPLTYSDKKIIGSLYHVINDIERIGDHAKNFMELAEEMNTRNLSFTEESIEEIGKMYEKVQDMFKEGVFVLEYRDKKRLTLIAKMENEIDLLCKAYSVRHIERMSKGTYSVESGTFYYDVISELERIGDHIVNIAYSVKNPTGSLS